MDSFEFNSIAIGGRIDRLRNEHGYSIEDLAARATLNKNTVNRVIKGVGKPNLNTFLKLCNALEVTPNELMGSGRDHKAHFRVIRQSEPGKLVFHEQEPVMRLGVLEDALPYGSMDCIVMEVAGRTLSSVRSHVGEELLICTKGRVGVIIGNTSVELEVGDAMWFHAPEPHRYYNADPERELSTALCVLTDSFMNDLDKLSVSE